MNELASFSGLIGDIYDATLDLALWPGVLKRISCFVPGSATTLESKDAVDNALNVFYQDGSVPLEMTRLYKTHLGRIYKKTGAVRQADLVKLVAGFAIPQIS